MSEQSDTPRTDTKWNESKLYNEDSFEISLDIREFAKKIEKELAAARAVGWRVLLAS